MKLVLFECSTAREEHRVKTQHPEQQGHMSDVKHHSYSSSFLHVVISTMFQEDVILLE